ncbi:MAG: glutamate racemase [Bacteroidia bacterium]|nr:glutamate racemase [Bacteroidia bacterium]
MNPSPIGIFDSGLGGLSVWKEVKKICPSESLIYYADSGNCPYGNRPAEEIIRLSAAITEFLLDKGCKLIVVACNTATSAAIQYLRAHFEVPFVGIEPALKPAATLTRTGHIGVLATRGTFAGEHYRRTREKFASDIAVHIQVGEGLVELVENHQTDTPEAEKLVRQYLEPMLEAKVDQIVLGCTHYPFLLPVMQKIAGERANILNPAPAVAQQVKRLLEKHKIAAPENSEAVYTFFSSGERAQLMEMVGRI